MQLSKRLSAVAKLVTPGSRLADVGCDHGYLPIALVKSGKVVSAIAMDVNEGPLMRARQNIESFAAAQYIETRLSDGLEALRPGEADSLILAGMGGHLMMRILEEGEEVLQTLKEIILQPQSEIAGVRRWLFCHGYAITAEDMVYEDGKYYTMIKAVHGPAAEEPSVFCRFGRLLLTARHPVLEQYLRERLEKDRAICEQIGKNARGGSQKKAEEIKKEMQEIISALSYYEMQ
ncbi:MAG TPA: class I SAM-dependent methyltransferase [Candidatus Ruminococcus avistercoris]|nr:class I SAM-dependent methyltransferase [Candidatus Ruminococcus avistercoris]